MDSGHASLGLATTSPGRGRKCDALLEARRAPPNDDNGFRGGSVASTYDLVLNPPLSHGSSLGSSPIRAPKASKTSTTPHKQLLIARLPHSKQSSQPRLEARTYSCRCAGASGIRSGRRGVVPVSRARPWCVDTHPLRNGLRRARQGVCPARAPSRRPSRVLPTVSPLYAPGPGPRPSQIPAERPASCLLP